MMVRVTCREPMPFVFTDVTFLAHAHGYNVSSAAVDNENGRDPAQPRLWISNLSFPCLVSRMQMLSEFMDRGCHEDWCPIAYDRLSSEIFRFSPINMAALELCSRHRTSRFSKAVITSLLQTS